MARSIGEVRGALSAALERGDHPTALKHARESLRIAPDAEGHYLLGCALQATSEFTAAHEAFTKATELDPEHADAHLALAEAAVQHMLLDEARMHLSSALRAEPLHEAALYFRGCLRELTGYPEGAARDFAAANSIDPEAFPVPVPLDDSTIESVVDAVLASLHPTLQEYLANVPILVEDMPSAAVLEEVTDAHPFELLGSFSGRSLNEADGGMPMTAWNAIPPTISIYRCNLQRFAEDREELVDELRITLLHEIGHFLGLDEDDLHERGLE